MCHPQLANRTVRVGAAVECSGKGGFKADECDGGGEVRGPPVACGPLPAELASEGC